MMRIFISVLTLAIAGCVTTSEVVPAGKDSYMIGASAAGGTEGGQSLIAATKAANAYCAALKKVMLIRNTTTGGSAGLGGEHSNLIFSCVSPDDPEYTRPNLRKDNGVTVIENR